MNVIIPYSDNKMKEKMSNTFSGTTQPVASVGFGLGLMVNSRDYGPKRSKACLPQNIRKSLNTGKIPKESYTASWDSKLRVIRLNCTLKKIVVLGLS